MRTRFSETQGAGPLQAGNKCSVLGLELTNSVIEHLGRVVRNLVNVNPGLNVN